MSPHATPTREARAWPRQPPRGLRWVVAVAAVLLMQGAQLAIGHHIQSSPIGPSLLAVAIAAWYGDVGPGALSVVLSLPGIVYFFLEPLYSWRVKPHGLVSLLVFAIIGAAQVALFAFLRQALRRSQEEIARRRQLEAERDLFLDALAHDLRNPIQALKLTTELLLRADELPPRLREPVRRASTISRRMERLVTSLLEFARLRSGGVELARRRSDLRAIAGEVVAELSLFPEAAARLRLDAETPAEGEWDPDRVAQIVQNVLANALAHSPAGSPVDVTVQAADGAAVFAAENVATNPDEALQRLESPWHGITRRQGAGLGLGLYVTRQLVEAHGGTLGATVRDGRLRLEIRLPRGSA